MVAFGKYDNPVEKPPYPRHSQALEAENFVFCPLDLVMPE